MFLKLPLIGAALAILSCSALAQTAAEESAPMTDEEMEKQFFSMIEEFGWERAGIGQLGDKAQIVIPNGYRFSGGDGCRQLMELYGNPPTDTELGVIAPENLDWCVVFEFEDVGYVKDEDKDELNAAKILAEMQSGQEQANEYRREAGMDELFVTGWAQEPKYNAETNNLEWAIRLRSSDGGESVNYLTRLLGREGVMSVTLVVGEDELQQTLPLYQKLLTGYNYVPGQTYAEFQQGDRVAQYTLAGLITAGAGFAAVKSGLFGKLGLLFAKLGKGIIVVVIAIGAVVKKFFSKALGFRQSPDA